VLAALQIVAPAARADEAVRLGPRPFYLVDKLDAGPLKDKRANGPFKRTTISIGHRGAAMQFPEHTEKAYRAGAWIWINLQAALEVKA
jgi:glycerophosphoryl diester phosphodiesterase